MNLLKAPHDLDRQTLLETPRGGRNKFYSHRRRGWGAKPLDPEAAETHLAVNAH